MKALFALALLASTVSTAPAHAVWMGPGHSYKVYECTDGLGIPDAGLRVVVRTAPKTGYAVRAFETTIAGEREIADLVVKRLIPRSGNAPWISFVGDDFRLSIDVRSVSPENGTMPGHLRATMEGREYDHPVVCRTLKHLM